MIIDSGGIVRSCDSLMYVLVSNVLCLHYIGTGETGKCSGHLSSGVYIIKIISLS